MPAAEKRNVESLEALATQISAKASSMVRERAGWNAEAKLTLIHAGSSCAAKWLSKLEVDPEFSDELCLAGAIITIAAGQNSLRNDLKQMLKEQREAEAKRQPILPTTTA